MKIISIIKSFLEHLCSLFTITIDTIDIVLSDTINDPDNNTDNVSQSPDSSTAIATTLQENSYTQSMYNNITVLLDAGHAKSTKGKRSPYSLNKTLPELPLLEYEFNRQLQSLIASKLSSLGIHAEIITPEIDTDIPLSTRASRANKIISSNPSNHHIFISIHGNASGNGSKWMSARGFSAYTTKGQNNSDKLAECICNAAESLLIPKGIKVREDESDGDKDWEENFTVIYKTNCPAVLTENLFYDNIEDCKIMLSDSGKELLADVHVQGILAYINQYLISVK